MKARFRDRFQAGRLLADLVRPHVEGRDPLVLALPRGGVPVAFEVARALDAELDVLVVRKLGVPGLEELAFGAIASGGGSFIQRALLDRLHVPDALVAEVVARESEELAIREHALRGARPPIRPQGRWVVLVDDGLATGSTMVAAARAIRAKGATAVIAAAPVADPSTSVLLDGEVDRTICVALPEPLHAVGLWYQSFAPTSDEQIRRLLDDAARVRAEAS